jgi:hypothetical protein
MVATPIVADRRDGARCKKLIRAASLACRKLRWCRPFSGRTEHFQQTVKATLAVLSPAAIPQGCERGRREATKLRPINKPERIERAGFR